LIDLLALGYSRPPTEIPKELPMLKTEATPKPIHLKDYSQPDFWIPTVALTFELGEDSTTVTSILNLERNGSRVSSKSAPLVLMGENLELKRLTLDGRELKSGEYSVTDQLLTIPNVPDRFTLEVETRIEPHKNLSCEGLYKSGGMFCTQCEAESFRKITYFLDRPDVMSVFTVTIRADKTKYPILLSNGNPVAARDLEQGRHEAVWHDPHKKPCYLFALVAGDLGVVEDTFRTRSGRDVKLQIFARKGLEDRCAHAMNSLKWSMKWDEDTYGLEYDLDIYMIVAADDFNMGAMENKGLNIFNASYVLAKPETATDGDFDGIMAVVAHEYFHNWTGNRITCRDWFQLSLKEGLTVFRDQRFSSDMISEAVKRIEEVVRLRTHQFAEDAGPMAHPVRPQSYISIDNFYTTTVYEKGAEVIRMIETIVGRDGFRKGMDLYFERHDGQAVTTEDFVAAMADANEVDLTQFKTWYDQAGTPVIKVHAHHDPVKELFTLTLEQNCPPSAGQTEKKPYHLPVAVGLLGHDGNDLALQLQDGSRLSSGSGSAGVTAATVSAHHGDHTLVLHLREPKQSFTFTGITKRPVVSILRNFSAPVRVEFDASDEDLAFLMAHDSDSFARWEAAQTLSVRTIKSLVADHQSGRALGSTDRLTAAFGPLLETAWDDPAYTSLMLALPAEQYLAQFFPVVDVDAIHAARDHVMIAIGKTHRSALLKVYERLSAEGTEGIGPKVSGRRSLRTRALEYLTLSDDDSMLNLALTQLRQAKNMTDELAALHALNRTTKSLRQTAMGEFYDKWKNESLVINKWFGLQALSPLADTLENVKRLAKDPVFDANNPNKIYSLFVGFSRLNAVRFHDKSGEAYSFIADQIMDIDSRNPQVAARLMSAFNQWRSFDSDRQNLMKRELARILAKPDLSSNVFEIASKTLNG
jgi:aminopeptidase N